MNSIEEYAKKRFKNKNDIITEMETMYFDDLVGWEWYELDAIFSCLDLSESNWSKSDFIADVHKDYNDEVGAYWKSTLIVYAEGKDKQDFLTLSRLWDKAQEQSEKDSDEDPNDHLYLDDESE